MKAHVEARFTYLFSATNELEIYINKCTFQERSPILIKTSNRYRVLQSAVSKSAVNHTQQNTEFVHLHLDCRGEKRCHQNYELRIQSMYARKSKGFYDKNHAN